MNWFANLLSDAGKLHVSSDAVKVASLVAGLAVGFFGHDWQGAVEVMAGGTALSLGISSQARKVTNAVTVDPNATKQVEVSTTHQ